jgi:6-phosphogluconolactonase
LSDNVKVFSSFKSLCGALVDDWFEGANQALNKQTTFNLGLSGGNTPRNVFQHLPEFEKWKRIPWDIVHIFWVDERCVKPDHSESNFKLASNLMLKDISIPEENIHRIHGENDPVVEANRYADELKKHFAPGKGQNPSLDWIFLGVGTDGHTASIFPGSTLASSTSQLCGVTTHPDTGQKRISLSLPVINAAKRITVIVSGQDKAAIVSRILNSPSENRGLPAGKIRPLTGNVEWALDELAASQLEKYT